MTVPGVCWRGVWVAPWKGPNGERVLLAIDRHQQLVTGDPVVVRDDAKYVDVSEGLWELLDREDPIRSEITISAPRTVKVRRSRRAKLQLLPGGA